jgi:hypothetical protein
MCSHPGNSKKMPERIEAQPASNEMQAEGRFDAQPD